MLLPWILIAGYGWVTPESEAKSGIDMLWGLELVHRLVDEARIRRAVMCLLERLPVIEIDVERRLRRIIRGWLVDDGRGRASFITRRDMWHVTVQTVELYFSLRA